MTFRHADAPTFVIPENVPVHKLLSYFLTEQMVQREPLKAWDFYFMSRRKGFYLCHAERDFYFMSRRNRRNTQKFSQGCLPHPPPFGRQSLRFYRAIAPQSGGELWGVTSRGYKKEVNTFVDAHLLVQSYASLFSSAA